MNMKKILTLLVVAASFLAAAEPSSSAYRAAASRLIWSDEFDQPPGSTPDPARWVYDLGASGWGNNELQTYTRAAENAAVASDPEAVDGKALVIRALKQPDGSYTSARLKTLGKFATVYGRVEARLKMPNGKGIWPAFWMMGENIAAVDWPACGEIDVVEVINADPNKVHGTIHGPGYSGANGITGTTTLPSGTLDQAYHVYAIDRSPDKIVWSFDGVVYHTATPTALPPGTRWVFNDTSFFMILNLAVGGNWPGYPDDSTPFPQTFAIDYIRVYAPENEKP
jgi:beta-glucanase (GH16 family)